MTSSARPRRLALAGVLVAAAVLGSGVVAAGAATPGPSAGVEDAEGGGAGQREATEAERAQRKAERKADQAQRKAARKADQAGRKADQAVPTGPAFVCDPALGHGQNVSAYARSLPKSPGRGRLVSQAARSDCGKPSAQD